MNLRSNLPVTIIAAAILLLCGCSERGASERPVPKPEGWPRMELPAPDYETRQFGDTEFPVNKGAVVSAEQRGDGWWIDLRYPTSQGNAVYLTLTPVSSPVELDAVLDNRRERMQLNAGGSSTALTELVSEGGWQCTLAETRSSLTTPIQILADDGKHVLSGALYLNVPPATDPDSIAPLVAAVRTDLMTALMKLRTR